MDDRYDVILADPPWKYDHQKFRNRAIENHYPTLTLEQISVLNVADIAADDCILFLWTTSPKLEDAFAVIRAWGFKYITSAVWDKELIGQGFYFRIQHEFLLICERGETLTPVMVEEHDLLLLCKRGKPPQPAPSDRLSSVMRERKTTHSTKPQIAYERIEQMYPNARKAELFARNRREGWDAWGDEVPPCMHSNGVTNVRPWPDAGFNIGECVDCHSTIEAKP